MQVFQDDLVYWGSLITGPTHNFLSIRLGRGEPDELIFTAKAGEMSPNLDILRQELKRVRHEFPLKGDLFPHEVMYRGDDTASVGCYRRVVECILREVKKA